MSVAAPAMADVAPAAGSSRTITVNGVRLNVYIEGQGPDVLLVHGFPDDHTVWRNQIPALVAAGFRVIAPDTRGCGESEMPQATAAYDVRLLIADLVALLDALKIDKVRLVAHDWGAAIGWQLCMAHPQRVDRYVAMSVGHPLAYAQGPLEQKLKGWYVLFFLLRGIAESALRAGNWWWFRTFTGFAAEAPHWIGKLRRPGRLRAGLNYYRANTRMFMARRWPRVRVPVFGIWSDRDRFLAEAQMTASRPLVDASWHYARVNGANHWLQLDAPERVNALLLDYLL